MIYNADRIKTVTINLGVQGENLANKVEIDVSSMVSKWPDSSIALLAQRSGETVPYIPLTRVKDGILEWDITATDTAVSGYGKIEIRCMDGDVIKKSVTGTTYTAKSMTEDPIDPPDPSQNWLEEVLAAGELARKEADRAEAAADKLVAVEAEAKTISYEDPASVEVVELPEGGRKIIYGIPQGAPGQKGDPGISGKDAPQIDDAQASPDHPWSGAKIADALKESHTQIPVRYQGTQICAKNTIPGNITTARNRVEILGQTIRNCLDHSSADKFIRLSGTIEDGYIKLVANGQFIPAFIKIASAVLKPSTEYTFVVEVLENTLQGSGNLITFGRTDSADNVSCFSSAKHLTESELSVGVVKFKLTTLSDFSNCQTADRCMLRNTAASGTLKFRYALVEGDWTNKEVYFVPFGLNTPQTTEIKMNNGLETDDENYLENTVLIDKPLASVSEEVRDRVYLKDGKVYYEKNCDLQNGEMVQMEPETEEITIGDFYSYAEQTNWTTTNTVKPEMVVDIPSNAAEVVGALMAEREKLKAQNAMLIETNQELSVRILDMQVQ